MNFYDLIMKKRNGSTLSDSEIRFFIQSYTLGEIPDYQVSALLMAIYFQGLDERETISLTREMLLSGETVDLSVIDGVKVDKHSTGGVGDTTSLIVAPLVASCGIPVAKMSGRGLGHTGGTIDKLESIPGFKVELPIQTFIDQVNTCKLALIGQTGNLAPADKKLYALRDVTATVDNLSLIASSIMSKKLAAGSEAIVLDVKLGSGAFMKTLEEAIDLAQTMVNIGEGMGKKVVALVTDMDQPLGFAIGNALEVKEALQVLNGRGPADLKELCLRLASEMIKLGLSIDGEAARKKAEEHLVSGKALQTFYDFISAQGGDVSVLKDPSKLPKSDRTLSIFSPVSGFVAKIDALSLGIAAVHIGAGRITKDVALDYGAGIVLNAKTGYSVQKGDLLATIHLSASFRDDIELKEQVLQAFTIGNAPPASTNLIHARIDKNHSERY